MGILMQPWGSKVSSVWGLICMGTLSTIVQMTQAICALLLFYYRKVPLLSATAHWLCLAVTVVLSLVIVM